jgi:hypothetical protein
MLLLHVRFAREDAAKRGAALAVPELADTLRRLGYAVKIRTALGGGSGGACLRSLRHSFLTVSVAGPTGAATYVVDPRFRDQVRRNPARQAMLCWLLFVMLAAVLRAAAALCAMFAAVCICLVAAAVACTGLGSRGAGSPLPAHQPLPAPACSPSCPLQFEIAHTTPRYSRILAAVGPEIVSSQDRLNKAVEILCAEMARAFCESGTPLPPWRQYAAMLSKWQPRRSEEVDVTAALNNGAGLLLPPMPVGGGQVQPGAVVVPGGAAAKRHLTGPSTVAQRLMMLGVAQQQSNPSPISEGVEHGVGSDEEGLNGWEALDGGGAAASTPTSSASSLHLDWEEATSGAATPAGPLPAPPAVMGGNGVGNGAAPAQPGGARPLAVPLRTASGSQALPAAAGEMPGRPPMGPARGKAILEGIRAAATALPHRRNNTWAG